MGYVSKNWSNMLKLEDLDALEKHISGQVKSAWRQLNKLLPNGSPQTPARINEYKVAAEAFLSITKSINALSEGPNYFPKSIEMAENLLNNNRAASGVLVAYLRELMGEIDREYACLSSDCLKALNVEQEVQPNKYPFL